MSFSAVTAIHQVAERTGRAPSQERVSAIDAMLKTLAVIEDGQIVGVQTDNGLVSVVNFIAEELAVAPRIPATPPQAPSQSRVLPQEKHDPDQPPRSGLGSKLVQR